MKLENQVLSIDQVQELIELGFDVGKYSSMCWVKYTSDEEPYEETYNLTVLDENCYEMSCLAPIPTLTIGDIMDILPIEINDKRNRRIYNLENYNLNDFYYYYSANDISIISFTPANLPFINILFEILKWCIKEKHIAL